MRKLPILLVAVVLATPVAAAAQIKIGVAELLESPDAFNGLEITVEGELIGDYGFRGDGSMWTQLNDDSYALDPVQDDGALTGGNVGVAVRIPSDAASALDAPGGYRVRGPVVEATGIWRYHDQDRGGESYVDVAELVIVEPGRELVEHPSYSVLIAGIVLVLAALVLRRGAKGRT